MSNYLKDSANNYSLYIDQGTSFLIQVPFSSFGVSSSLIDSLSFTGSIKQHQSSKKYIDISLNKNTISGNLELSIAPDISSTLTSTRYIFDVIYKNNNNNNIVRAFGGIVIVKPNLSSF